MKFLLSFKNVGTHEAIEKDCAPHVQKIERLLKTYAPDLVQLHGFFEGHARKPEFDLSLNLSLPTGTLHCVGSGADIRKSLKAAFSELEGQIKKHQARLRHDYEWKRKRPRAIVPA
jgi:ribosome-associated translation inhibitor RaiA